jgi:hypothetical protein
MVTPVWAHLFPLDCSQPTCEKTHTNQDRDDRALQRLVRRMPFAISPVLKQHWLPNRRLYRLSSDQWILRHVLKFQPHLAKHYAKRDRQCRSANSGRLMTLLDLSPADFRRFLVNRRLLGSQCCLSTPKYCSLCHKEHPANCPVRWRLSSGLGVYLSWLQAGFSHHTRQPIYI